MFIVISSTVKLTFLLKETLCLVRALYLKTYILKREKYKVLRNVSCTLEAQNMLLFYQGYIYVFDSIIITYTAKNKSMRMFYCRLFVELHFSR